jgi:hypothetical protein
MILGKIKIDEKTQLVIVKNNYGIFGALKFRLRENDKKWYYQHLQLSVRAGAKTYFPYAKELYRKVKREVFKNAKNPDSIEYYKMYNFKRLFV